MIKLKVSFPHVLLILVSLNAIIFSGCSDSTKLKGLSEGYIEYAIEYDNYDPQKYSNKLRPNLMVIKFKDNNTINKIEGLSGAFSFAFIQDTEAKKTYTLMKLFNKKLVYEEPICDTAYPYAYEDMPKFTLQITNETEEILGLTCQKAIATFVDSVWDSFEILYTSDLAIENPNYNTPFEQLNGVMLKFSVILFNQRMNIHATSIKASKIPYDEFKVPEYYENIEKETVRDVIELLE